MKIRVKGFFQFKPFFNAKGETVLDVPQASIRDVLNILIERHGPKFTDILFHPDTNDIHPDNQILINGRHYRHLTQGLDSPLNDGDFLAIFPPVAGG
jgi:molybdopterin synthase sulfur carrier subunit